MLTGLCPAPPQAQVAGCQCRCLTITHCDPCKAGHGLPAHQLGESHRQATHCLLHRAERLSCRRVLSWRWCSRYLWLLLLLLLNSSSSSRGVLNGCSSSWCLLLLLLLGCWLLSSSSRRLLSSSWGVCLHGGSLHGTHKAAGKGTQVGVMWAPLPPHTGCADSTTAGRDGPGWVQLAREKLGQPNSQHFTLARSCCRPAVLSLPPSPRPPLCLPSPPPWAPLQHP